MRTRNASQTVTVTVTGALALSALALGSVARVAHAEEPEPKAALSTPKPTPGPQVDPPPTLAAPEAAPKPPAGEPAPVPAPPVKKPEGAPLATAPNPAPAPHVVAHPPPSRTNGHSVVIAPIPEKYKYEKEHPRPKTVPTFRLGAGYDWHSYYGVPFRGFDMNADIGFERDWLGAYLGVGGSFDSTSATLSSRKLRFEFGTEAIFGRVRLGLELNLAYLNIDRVTADHDNFEVLTAGLNGQVSVDVIRFQPRGAVYVQAKLGGDIFPNGDGGESAGWGSTFSIGFRY